MLESLTRINGRMGRLHWWLTQLVIMVIGFIAAMLQAPTVAEVSIGKSGDPTADASLTLMHLQEVYMDPLQLVLALLQQWLFISSTLQRRHDRNKAGLTVYITYIVTGFMIFAIYGIAHKDMLVSGSIALFACLAALAVLGIWIFITCGLLPGDGDANDYGEPPGIESREQGFDREIQTIQNRGMARLQAESGYDAPQYAAARSVPAETATQRGGPPVFGRR